MNPSQPKIYHIVHVERLASILANGCLWSDGAMRGKAPDETMIGIQHIKDRRLNENMLYSHFGLMVGECVPFYFCPRSVMLFLINKRGEDLSFKGGQGPIIHLEADLHNTVQWAEAHGKRWAFTSSNAGSRYFEDWADLSQLGQINWSAVRARKWSGLGIDPNIKEKKQAEFLVEEQFPWELVERVGVLTRAVGLQVHDAFQQIGHRPKVEILPNWYY